MATEPSVPVARDPIVPRDDRAQRKIRDALTLLDFAVESGFKDKDDHSVPESVIATIQTVAANFGPVGVTAAAAEAERPGAVTASEWVEFDKAYYQLSVLLRPITAETLRNTEGTSLDALTAPDANPQYQQRLSGWDRAIRWRKRAANFFLGYSPAQRFTRGLWIVAILFATFVVLAEWCLSVTALEGDQAKVKFWRTLIELLVPWAYGGLGSCVYLLKSAHIFIHERTFDLRRKPEYFNRVLLGTIAGGAIILFINQITADDGTTTHLSSAALGFLAGYSTEFLYQTLERIIGAILPKVGLDTVARQRPPSPPSPPGAAELTDMYKAAKSDEDRAVFLELIKQLGKTPSAGAPASPRPRSRNRGGGNDEQ